MKNKIFKYIGYLTCLSMIMVSIFSCTEEIEGPDILKDKDGSAVINYVRVTDPLTSDSLLTGAFLGSLIAIIGDNLGDTKELYFNDQKARLNPTYITDKSIIVNVPTTVPTVVNNEMKLIFSDQSELTYSFTINVPAPVVNSIKSEYVPTGGVAEIQGDFFFAPMKVEFPGGVEGTIVSLEKTEIKVEVPEGAQPGNIKVTTNFGSTNSPFIFRDDRNILLDFDNFVHETWTARIGYDDVQGVTPVDGNFAYFKSDNHGAWQWVNEMTMQYWAPRGRGAVPIANGLVSDLVFKMEVNIPVAWEDVRMEIFFAPSAETEGRGNPDVAIYRWAPFTDGPFKTEGWETFEFPLTEFVHNTANDDPSQAIDDLSGLSNVTMMVFGPASGTVPILIAIDNLRIVPK